MDKLSKITESFNFFGFSESFILMLWFFIILKSLIVIGIIGLAGYAVYRLLSDRFTIKRKD